ncbi:T9SS C-terminal target domain-containing protein [Lacihabitans sp. LS3-19]|uniref:NPCBM/NEW2 domain-containing protein n=1 Tax=Lacihabitans sp. LS3-19 TaxID=2487335 RepID=UPI0020CD9F15|nr:NPCBM/NEW2 domain-containing protein [Lacihabitans sp. LS3-19]MCP9768288.1 T9SS C-terminal target domain-containing protein [Lacihabitans sp. LS3-19]
MKKFIVLSMALLCSFFSIAQTNLFGKITYPADGIVFQRTSSSNSVTVSIQVRQINSNWKFRLYKGLGIPYSNTEIQTGVITSLPNLTSKSNGDMYTYHAKFSGLSEGWYSLEIYYEPNPGFKLFADYVTFGIGDVYVIAGQSNASAYNFLNRPVGDGTVLTPEFNEIKTNRRGMFDFSGSEDATVSFLENVNNFGPKITRTLNYNGRWDWASSVTDVLNPYNDLSPIDGNVLGLPYKKKFEYLRHGTNKFSEPIYIFPNGHASWYWAALGQKIASTNNTPTLFLNTAYHGSGLVSEWGVKDGQGNLINNNAKKFFRTLGMYGGICGVKSILWHQGEQDAAILSQAPGDNSWSDYNNTTQVISDYSARLNDIINKSRQVLNSGTNLSWYVSQVSMFTGKGNIINDTGKSGLSSPIQLPNNSQRGATHYYIHSGITGQQAAVVNLTNKVFEGVTDSDNITGDSRDETNKLHYSGNKLYGSKNTLQEMGDRWYTKIYQNHSSSTGVAPQDLVKISSISQSGSNITITYESIPGAKYYFTTDEKGVYSGTGLPLGPSGNTYLNTNLNSNSWTFNADIPNSQWLTAYVEDANGKFRACQPYIATNLNQVPAKKTLWKRIFGMDAPSNSSTISNELRFENVVWEISSKPSWVNNIQFVSNGGEENLRLSLDMNSGNLRSGTVVVSEVGGGVSTSFTITQEGSTSITTPLTSLNPTITSGYYRLNKSFGNITMKIADTQYTQGIGVHANSSLTYNLGGQYNTFNFKIGQDDESNCGDGVQFSIKADGVIIYGPVTKTYWQPATVQSVSVSGKNTLELIVNMGSNDYCDHADWAEVYLQSGSSGCGTPPIAPTAVSASPSSISSGGSSTLAASCAYGAVTWSNGSTGNSISISPSVTTNYTVKCVSAGCPDSPVVGVTVNVSNSPCSAVTNNLTMGTWTVTGHPLVARYFHNQYWLTQRIGTNPEKFLVRGSNMLTRGDVTLNNVSYSGLTTCFAWQNSNYGGLAVPNSTEFPTPSGFTLGYEPDGTPFYTANGSCGLSAPTNVSASPASIISGQSSTLSATCATGTRLWSTGATSATIVVSPASTTTYTVKCTQSGCPDSPTTSVTVQVGPCASLSHNLVMGTWTVTGHPLVAKYYNNQWWLVQRIATNPEKFLVRGSEMLTRGDVTLTNGSYSSLVGCFTWTYSAYGGLQTPNSTEFPTPSGWQFATEPDGTPFYTSIGGARQSTEQNTTEEEQPKFVSVFPNPNHGEFKVKVYLEEASDLSIDLISSSGKIYQSQKAVGVKGENEIPFKAQNISGGNYLIRVKSKDKVESTTVVIQ